MAILFIGAILVIGYISLHWKGFLLYFLLIFSLVLLSKHQDKKHAESALRTKLIEERPIIKRCAEKTGYSKIYSLDDDDIHFSNHYQYKEVVDGYEARFKVVCGDGKIKYVTCKKGDEIYKKLINKAV